MELGTTRNDPFPEEGEEGEGETATFEYRFRSNATSYLLRVPVNKQLGATGSLELAARLIQAHRLPCYVEEELASLLETFAWQAVLRVRDAEGERALAAGAETSVTDRMVDQWVETWCGHTSLFSPSPTIVDSALPLSEVYHKLIHSPALEELLQLEHNYAIAVETLLQAWSNAVEVMSKRHDSELKAAMTQLGYTKSERDIAHLMSQHETERMVLEAQWRGEINHLQMQQRKGYRQWMDGVYEEMMASGGKKSKRAKSKRLQAGLEEGRGGREEEREGRREESMESLQSSLEESFTIHLGAQLKSSHNIRLSCGHPLDLCRTQPASASRSSLPRPERLQTAMNIYSHQLSCVVMMVDKEIENPTGLEARFASICQQNTDFHFPSYSEQLSRIKSSVHQVAASREIDTPSQLLDSSFSSRTSESQVSVSRVESPFESPERGVQPIITSDGYLSPSSLTGSGRSLTSEAGRRRSPTNEGASRVVQRGGSVKGGSGGEVTLRLFGDQLHFPTGQEETNTHTTLQAGDVFVTHHSNLAQVHVVLHLATDPAAVASSSLRARHPVMAGLKNCLKMAARNDVNHVTVPLLLVHSMTPEMTITWCVRRAELVFKCVKGFLLENPTWGYGDSRTIQFMIPSSTSRDLFEEFCEMLPKIFRIPTARKLVARNRTHSYK